MKTYIYFLLLIVVILSGYFLFNINKNSVIQQNTKDEFYCKTDSDCIPFVYECGDCEDYSIAINKKYTKEYQERYWKKCENKEQRDCDALPKGKSTCSANKCTLIK